MNYEVGDRVKIKSWDRMKEEFGIEEGGYLLKVKLSFVLGMEDFLTGRNSRMLTIIKKKMMVKIFVFV